MSKKHHLYSSSPDDITALLAKLGEPAFRSRQLCDWLFKKKVVDFSKMRNIPVSLQEKLKKCAVLTTLKVQEKQAAKDNKTCKWLFSTSDNCGIEAVLICEKERHTICVSTAVGCPLNCHFCASSQGKHVRNLTAGEIVEQVVQIENLSGLRATNIVFMGTGEPFLNYDEVLKAARILRATNGFAIGARHITISTVGVVTAIDRFAAEPEGFRLAFSLHAPNQKAREKIIPSAAKWKLPNILAALRRYTRETRREITIEYILIDGFNCSLKDSENLGKLLADIPCKINCIPYNQIDGLKWRKPDSKQCREFVKQLTAAGFRAILRQEKGTDISAACGQLRARSKIQ